MQTELASEVFLSAGTVDFTGRWRPSAILESMQDTGIAHSELIGVSRAVLLRRDMIWILSRAHLQMHEYPMMDERVRIRTWPGMVNRFFYPRYFVFEKLGGERLGAAVQLWLLLDLNSRSVVSPVKSGLTFSDTSHLPAPLPAPDRVARLESGEVFSSARVATYTDLDVNSHVNNTRYADWACDMLPLETLRTHCVENLLLNYTKEVLPGSPVHCSLTLDQPRFSLLGASEDGTQTYFEVGGTLAPWHSDRRV